MGFGFWEFVGDEAIGGGGGSAFDALDFERGPAARPIPAPRTAAAIITPGAAPNPVTISPAARPNMSPVPIRDEMI